MSSVMVQPSLHDIRYTVDEYFGLVAGGLLHPDDRVELLEGVIVAMAPQNPPHAGTITIASDAIRSSLGDRAVIRVQLPLILGPHSAPEPDIAVVPGPAADYFNRHPTTAWLLVEVAEASLPQDRLTKARMYAAAAIPEYWIINVRERCVEVFRQPDQALHAYRGVTTARRGDRLELWALPGAVVQVTDLLPAAD